MIIFSLTILATALHFYIKWKEKELLGIGFIISGALSLMCLDEFSDNLIMWIVSILLLIFNVVLNFMPEKKGS